MNRRLRFLLLSICWICLGLFAQDDVRPLKTIDEVIEGIDSLLDDIDRTSGSQVPAQQASPQDTFLPNTFEGNSPNADIDRSYRMQNELMLESLRDGQSAVAGSEPLPATNLDDINPEGGQIEQPPLRSPRPITGAITDWIIRPRLWRTC